MYGRLMDPRFPFFPSPFLYPSHLAGAGSAISPFHQYAFPNLFSQLPFTPQQCQGRKKVKKTAKKDFLKISPNFEFFLP
jgi:hypothetical protein